MCRMLSIAVILYVARHIYSVSSNPKDRMLYLMMSFLLQYRFTFTPAINNILFCLSRTRLGLSRVLKSCSIGREFHRPFASGNDFMGILYSYTEKTWQNDHMIITLWSFGLVFVLYSYIEKTWQNDHMFITLWSYHYDHSDWSLYYTSRCS